MANTVQWIKIATDIFDDEKILLIDSLSESDSIIIIWFKLLCLAGKQNNKGVLLFNNISYTPKMLSTIFRRSEETIKNALKIFEDYGMIHYINTTLAITNWGKHQNLDKIEANKAYMRNYMREYRKKQSDIANGKNEDKVNGKLNRKVKINLADKEIEKDKEKDKDKEINKDYTSLSSDDCEQASINYQQIVDSFHSICVSIPKVKKITEKRKNNIKSAKKILEDMTFEQFFEKIESSDFLTGRQNKWCCNFDWIMNPDNIIKILEGNYDNRKNKNQNDYSDYSKYENMEMGVL